MNQKNRSISHLFQGYKQKNAKSRVIVMVAIKRNKKTKTRTLKRKPMAISDIVIDTITRR